jgi:ferric-dicitrate binding protein FerR (iron transport regulator)
MTSEQEEDAIARLIAGAGPLTVAAPEEEAAIRNVVHAEWRAMVDGRRRVRGRWMAIAASVAFIAVLAVGWRSTHRGEPVPVVQVAMLSQSVPDIVIRRAEELPQRAFPRGMLVSNDVLETAEQGVRIQMASGTHLRIAPHSRVRFQDRERLALDRGALYFDGKEHEAALAVTTPFGTVQHMGTRYLMQLLPSSLVVSVRDGSVRVDAGDRKISIDAHQQASIDRDGRAQREQLSSAADMWGWVDALAAPIVIENLPLDRFLEWAARETGREVVYRDDNTRRAASETVLHGSIEHLTPRQAVETMLATTDFKQTARGERIEVSRQ